jgi:hypothetical protein
MGRVAGRFARVEPRRRMRKLVLGLLSDLPRKNCWTIAQWVGDTAPDCMRHLLGRAKREARVRPFASARGGEAAVVGWLWGSLR